MPSYNMSGSAVATGLIADAFAEQISIAARTGCFGMQDNSMNPLDLFPAPVSSGSPTAPMANDMGVAIVILNSLPTPLVLQECFAEPTLLIGGGTIFTSADPQASYPASIDPATGAVTNVHTIPAARPYPVSSSHQSNGKPVMLHGLGLYRFTARNDAGTDQNVYGGLSFSKQANGAGRMIGIGFRFTFVEHFFSKNTLDVGTSVMVDFETRFGTLRSYCDQTIAASGGSQYEGQSTLDTVEVRGTVTAAGQANATREPFRRTMTFWIYDSKTYGSGAKANIG